MSHNTAIQMADMLFGAITGDIKPIANFNGRVGGEGAYYDLRAAADRRLEDAERSLSDEFEAAFLTGPQATVRTPALGLGQKRTVADIVADSFACARKGDQWLSGVLEVVRFALKSEDHAVRLMAQAWLAGFQKDFAEFHAGDLLIVGEQ